METRPSQRDETDAERLDRNLSELLQELRVAQTGVQVLFAFLLVLPFNERFRDVSAYERGVYFATLLFAAGATLFLIAPSAHHRVLFRLQDKRHVVFLANTLALAGTASLALAMTGAILLITTFLFGAAPGAIVAAVTFAGFVFVWYAVPWRRRRSRRRGGGVDGDLVTAARAYAAERHVGQTRRADGAPFIRHPEEVAGLLRETGAPEPVVAAGLLHDVVEKTPATVGDLEERFGSEVARLVDAVSEDDRISSYAPRKRALIDSALGAGPNAAAVFAADKVCKVRDFRARLLRADGRDHLEARKLEYYRQSLVALERTMPDHPLVRRLRQELAEVETVAR